MNIGTINAATPTPLLPDGALDEASTRRLCRRWLSIGLDGVFILGSMGEGSFLSDATRNRFVEIVVEEVKGRMTIFASASDLSYERMKERALSYAQLGVDYVIFTAPPGRAAKAIVSEIKRLADKTPIPCGYYEVPTYSHDRLTINDIIDIALHENIHVLKDSSNNPLLSHTLTSGDYLPKDVMTLDGNEFRSSVSAMLGYGGVLHGGAVLTGRRVRAIWDSVHSGDFTTAIQLDRENSFFLAAVYDRMYSLSRATIGQKYALQLLGVFEHECVALDQHLDDEARGRIRLAVDRNRDWLLPDEGPVTDALGI